MRISVVSLFPGLIQETCNESIVGRAHRRGLVDIRAIDPRRWAGGRHRIVDGRPYGGGPGMVLAAPPIASAIDALSSEDPQLRLLMPTPQGRRLDHQYVSELAQESHLAFICGHYEGIDERIVDLYHPEEFSIGDFVVSGGELPTLLAIDAVVRLQPGALGDADSAVEDSFAGDDNLLDHPCYTKPREFRGLKVPNVLLGGDHAAIEAWRHEERLRRTKERRPDLLP